MKNNPQTENELTYELEEEYELSLDNNDSNISLLVKHDYYASDSEHGRELLSAFIRALSQTGRLDHIFLVDSGVKILDPGHFAYSSLMDAAGSKETCITVCSDSISYYGISLETVLDVVDKDTFFSLLIYQQNLIISE